MNLKPIVLDLETSGLDLVKNGIWQIGAIDLNTMEEFLGECRIDDEDAISEEALKVTGKTEEELRYKNKQSQKELLEKFMSWIKGKKMKNFLCQNPQFDVGFIGTKTSKYGLKNSFNHRAFDLHSISQTKYHEIKKGFIVTEDYSGMGLTNTLKFCGMEDRRQNHNALDDCKLTAECFSRLLYGKNLFPEYSQFGIPEELKR